MLGTTDTAARKQQVMSPMDATFKFDKLDGTNYATWSLRMQMTLMQQDLWAVVSKDLAASAATSVACTAAFCAAASVEAQLP